MKISFKIKTIIFSSILLVVIISMLSIKLYISLNFPKNIVKNNILIFIKNNFNKAVKFDNVNIDFFGNIVIENLHISKSSDFNDNINLIKSKETIIKLSLYELFNQKFIINSIDFDNVEINFLKQYGKNYKEVFKNILFINKNYNELKDIDIDNLKINFKNGKINYKEKFKNKNLEIEVNNFNLKLNIKNEKIEIATNGNIVNYKTKWINNGKFDLSGYIYLEKYKNYKGADLYLKCSNLDISYINPYIDEVQKYNILLQGGASLAVKIVSLYNDHSINSRFSLVNFGIARKDNNEKYMILSNENVKIDFNCDFYNTNKKIEIKDLKIKDDNFEIETKLTYIKNKLQNNIEGNFKTNTINLDVLSRHFTPIKAANYGGELKASGSFNYDLLNHTARKMDMDLFVNELWLNKIIDGKKQSIINALNSDLKLKNNQIKLNLRGMSDSSDYNISINSFVKKWYPIKTDTNVDFSSQYMQMSHLKYLFINGIKNTIDMAYEDRKKGYNEIYFRQKLLGKLLNNNNINTNLKILKVGITNQTFVNDLMIELNLDKGNLSTKHFNVTGYGAKYKFNIDGQLNRDMPKIHINGAIDNFNLGAWSFHEWQKVKLSGMLNFGFDYEITGFRLKHLVNNAHTLIWANVKNVQLRETDLQNKLSTFFSNIEIENNFDELDIKNANYEFKETGENYYIRKFSMNSNIINFASRGRYIHDNGYKVPINCIINIQDSDTNRIKRKSVPLYLKGHFLEPKIVKKNNINKDEILFF